MDGNNMFPHNLDNVASGAELHVPVQATDATENDVYIHPAVADRQNQHQEVELHAEGAGGGTSVNLNQNNMHSLRTSRGHYQNVLAEVHGQGYAWDVIHKALLEYLRIGRSLSNLGAENLQGILEEWGTPLSQEALAKENKRLRRRTVCHFCDEKPLEILFLPCANLVACAVCAPKFTQCPCCTARITRTVRVFMS